MKVTGISKLTPKQRERVKAKLSKQEKRDILQRYLPNGKVNPDFVKVYGKEKLKQGIPEKTGKLLDDHFNELEANQ